MKRREFIGIAAAGAAGMVVPGVGHEGASTRFDFARPGLLQFLPEHRVRELGRRYREIVPAENHAGGLTRALGAGTSAGSVDENVYVRGEADSPHAELAARVQDDFASGRTVILHGWILSLTEARQCALFSLQPV